MNPKFRNSNGLGYTKALFYEMVQDREKVLYTLKDQDHEGYPSLYRLYMECSDPTEYRFATQYFDGWAHWEDISLCDWFRPHIEKWRRELEVRTRSEALARILDTAKSGNPKTLMQSNKFLLDGGWVSKDQRKVGRPTKEAIQKETARLADIQRQLNEDLERVT